MSRAARHGAGFGRTFPRQDFLAWDQQQRLNEQNQQNQQPIERRRAWDSLRLSEKFLANRPHGQPLPGQAINLQGANRLGNLHHPLLAGLVGMPAVPPRFTLQQWSTSQYIHRAYASNNPFDANFQMIPKRRLQGAWGNLLPHQNPPQPDDDGWLVFADSCTFPFWLRRYGPYSPLARHFDQLGQPRPEFYQNDFLDVEHRWSLDFVVCLIRGYMRETYFSDQGPEAALNLPQNGGRVYRVNAICLPRLPVDANGQPDNDPNVHGYSDLDSKILWLAGYGVRGLVRREFLQNNQHVQMDTVMRPYEYYGYEQDPPPANAEFRGAVRLKMLRARALVDEERWDLTLKCLYPEESMLDYQDAVRARVRQLADYHARTSKTLSPVPFEGNEQDIDVEFRQSITNVRHLLLCG